MEEVLRKDWSVLDRGHAIQDRKWHLVLVSWHEGQYEVQARQVDGSTGLVSPLRRGRTSDRLWVSRLAGLLVAQDFGIVGTLGTKTADQRDRLYLKAAGLGAGPAVKVQPGDVFALAELRGRDGQRQGVRLPYTLFVVESVEDGECRGRIHPPARALQAGDARLVTIRALKLTTRPERLPLRLRVLDARTGEPLQACEVTASARDFDSLQLLGNTDAEGRFSGHRGAAGASFAHVVFVRVARDGIPLLAAAIPLVDDRPEEFRLQRVAEADDLARFLYRYRPWLRSLNDTLVQARQGLQRLEELPENKREQALAAASELAEKLQSESKRFRDELGQHKLEAQRQNIKAAGSALAIADQLLADLQALETHLAEVVRRKRNAAPLTPAEKLAEAARLKEVTGDIEEALRLYEQSLKQHDQPAVRSRWQRLREAWKIRSPAQQQARTFIYGTWARLAQQEVPDLPEVRTRLREAGAALKDCAAAGDHLAARKLFDLNQTLADRLGRLQEQLANDTDPQRTALLKEISLELDQLNRDVFALLNRAANP
jgi:hypothetical protein